MAESKKNKDGTVKIKLFKSKDKKYSQPLKVFLNGKGYCIPRGIEVEIPKSVAEIIKNAERQENAAVTYSASIAAD